MPLTLFDHWATCRSFSQWHAQPLRGSQSAQSRNPLSHSHHKPPWNEADVIVLKPFTNTMHYKPGRGFTRASYIFKTRNTSWTQRYPDIYLAGEDVSECGECIVQGLVINRLVQVLDEDVAHSTLPQWGVTLRPHDAKRPTLDHVKVHRVQGSLS